MTNVPETPPINWEFRRQTIVCSEALLRIMHGALKNYGDDFDGTLIYLAICCASVGGALRDPHLSTNPPPPGPMGRHHYRPVSRRAIAASTGLPRETVRRKIAAFVARGDLVAERRGVRIRDDLLEDSRNFEFARLLQREFARTGALVTAYDG